MFQGNEQILTQCRKDAVLFQGGTYYGSTAQFDSNEL